MKIVRGKEDNATTATNFAPQNHVKLVKSIFLRGTRAARFRITINVRQSCVSQMTKITLLQIYSLVSLLFSSR